MAAYRLDERQAEESAFPGVNAAHPAVRACLAAPAEAAPRAATLTGHKPYGGSGQERLTTLPARNPFRTRCGVRGRGPGHP